jgi:4-hydroxy 2-oxovalerate aldolase
MQSVGKSTTLISEAAKACEQANCIDVLYFADSLGNMNSEECLRIIKALKSEWSGELGIHAHDNTSQALSNSIFSAEQGVTFIDSTITGMGRGAGNVKTEILLTEISLRSKKEYSPSALYRVVLDTFESMQKQCGWGTSLLYHVGAKKNIHPTYIQQLISESRFSAAEKAKAIEYLGSIEASSYSYQNLEMALTAQPKISTNNTRKTDSLEGQFAGREVLLIGAGPSTSRYQAAIRQYISKIKPIVISININENFKAEEIDYYAISHNIKFFTDSEKYHEISKKIIAPISRFEDQPLTDARNYGLQLSDAWHIAPDQCSIPYELTAAYALALCVAGTAASVTLTGFDGYDLLDERNKSVQDTLNYFDSILPIQCLTPTNYRVRTGSIYAI